MHTFIREEYRLSTHHNLSKLETVPIATIILVFNFLTWDFKFSDHSTLAFLKSLDDFCQIQEHFVTAVVNKKATINPFNTSCIWIVFHFNHMHLHM